MGLGHYNNGTGKYEEREEVTNAHWLIDEDGNLYIIDKEDNEDKHFESFGYDEDKLEQLNALTEEQLSDDEVMCELGFDIAYNYQRRFDPEVGYYVS
tara:strand:- start:409 stop:699 length:291 start_codon:yes stop_codon:yes gene_type:complete